jgi:hypothetical protein
MKTWHFGLASALAFSQYETADSDADAEYPWL